MSLCVNQQQTFGGGAIVAGPRSVGMQDIGRNQRPRPCKRYLPRGRQEPKAKRSSGKTAQRHMAFGAAAFIAKLSRWDRARRQAFELVNRYRNFNQVNAKYREAH